MPYMDKLTDDTKKQILEGDYFCFSPHVTISLDEMKRRVAAGQKLEVRCSSFEDPGADWNQLVLGGQDITPRIPGY